jgi:uncharacterized SAM-binding protein YcdF (DUF218 family)
MSLREAERAGRFRLRRLGLPMVVLAALVVLWLGGLVWFARSIPSEVADAETKTDAIVVLTGGSLRVQSGLALLAAGKAQKLFISGVYHSTDVAALLHVSRQSPEHIACCIVLGHEADNTLGNALETAQWMRSEGFHSLRLVTASYHMPRSLLEFSRAMPDIRIIPNPVFPEQVKQRRWWAFPGTAMLFLGEYNKYLAALIRPFLLGNAVAEAPQ